MIMLPSIDPIDKRNPKVQYESELLSLKSFTELLKNVLQIEKDLAHMRKKSMSMIKTFSINYNESGNRSDSKTKRINPLLQNSKLQTISKTKSKHLLFKNKNNEGKHALKTECSDIAINNKRRSSEKQSHKHEVMNFISKNVNLDGDKYMDSDFLNLLGHTDVYNNLNPPTFDNLSHLASYVQEENKSHHSNISSSFERNLNGLCAYLISQYIRDEKLLTKYFEIMKNIREKTALAMARNELFRLKFRKNIGSDLQHSIKKKQRALLMKLHQEYSEIKIMKNFQKKLSDERKKNFLRQLKHFRAMFSFNSEYKSLDKKCVFKYKQLPSCRQSYNKSPMKCYSISFLNHNENCHKLKRNLDEKQANLNTYKEKLNSLLRLHYDLHLNTAALSLIECMEYNSEMILILKELRKKSLSNKINMHDIYENIDGSVYTQNKAEWCMINTTHNNNINNTLLKDKVPIIKDLSSSLDLHGFSKSNFVSNSQDCQINKKETDMETRILDVHKITSSSISKTSVENVSVANTPNTKTHINTYILLSLSDVKSTEIIDSSYMKIQKNEFFNNLKKSVFENLLILKQYEVAHNDDIIKLVESSNLIKTVRTFHCKGDINDILGNYLKISYTNETGRNVYLKMRNIVTFMSKYLTYTSNYRLKNEFQDVLQKVYCLQNQVLEEEYGSKSMLITNDMQINSLLNIIYFVIKMVFKKQHVSWDIKAKNNYSEISGIVRQKYFSQFELFVINYFPQIVNELCNTVNLSRFLGIIHMAIRKNISKNIKLNITITEQIDNPINISKHSHFSSNKQNSYCSCKTSDSHVSHMLNNILQTEGFASMSECVDYESNHEVLSYSEAATINSDIDGKENIVINVDSVKTNYFCENSIEKNSLSMKSSTTKNYQVEEAEELRKKQLAVEMEIKALLEQQTSQIQYFLMREIPDKPPPPYIPPTDESKSNSSVILKSYDHIDTFNNIEIEDVVRTCFQHLWFPYLVKTYKNDDEALLDFKNSCNSFYNSTLHCMKNPLLYDLCNELFYVEYKDINRTKNVWDYKKKLSYKKKDVCKRVENLAKQYLGYDVTVLKDNMFINCAHKLQDHVDELLIKELQDEEPEWVNVVEYEVMIKNDVTEYILKSLITETINELKLLHNIE